MRMHMSKRYLLGLSGLFACAALTYADQTYRLYEGITAYVNNPDGKDFTVTL